MARDWLGTGIAFPVRPGSNGRLRYVSGLAAVRQSISSILDTEPGERLMLPAFGCGLRRFLMEPNSVTTRAAIRDEVSLALSRWEPRIRLTDVSVTAGEDPALVWLQISYELLAERRADDLVYPFYLQ